MRVRLLVISADTVVRESTKRQARGFPVLFDAVPSRQHAERLFSDRSAPPPQAILIDPQGNDPSETVRWARQIFPRVRAIFLMPANRSGEKTVLTTAFDPEGWGADVDMVMAGACDQTGFGEVLRRLVEGAASAGERNGLSGLDELVGRSMRFREALDLAVKAASNPHVPVLLVGERGTGKRLFARAIHAESEGAAGPLIRFDCRARTARGLETVLLGKVVPQGGGSDAEIISGSPGTAGGTLFLDEIAGLNLGHQAKVLAYLDEVLGHAHRTPSPSGRLPRLIAATSRNLEGDARTGNFNRDLLAKLRDFKIDLPPLRERPSDILLLAELFMKQRTAQTKMPVPTLIREVQEQLLAHPWPGNIRGLFGVLEAALEAAGGARRVESQHLPNWIPQSVRPAVAHSAGVKEASPAPSAVKSTGASARVVSSSEGVIVELPDQGIDFEEIERAVLSAALRKTGNNVVRAANLLRLGRGSLRYRLEKYGLVETRRRRSAKRRSVGPEARDCKDILKQAS